MIICGLKLSHDAGIAVIDGNRLLFNIELEKVANGFRYSDIGDLSVIAEILATEGVELTDIDRFVVDGWWTTDKSGAASIPVSQSGRKTPVPVAPYTSDEVKGGLLHRFTFPGIPGGPLAGGYSSYSHAAHHAMASYCTSPFAERGEQALVLAWDGGMLPRLYRVSQKPLTARYLGALFPLLGDTFTYLCKYLEPFARDWDAVPADEYGYRLLEIPGKAMAYAALGTVAEDAFAAFQKLIDELDPMSFGLGIGEAVQARRIELFEGLSNADLIATYQDFLGRMLVSSLHRAAERSRIGDQPNLCLSGGCALNIKWNSVLRDTGTFASIWVPPFTNDSGAGIGTACCELIGETGQAHLSWDVYSGPRLAASSPAPGWTARRCDEAGVAALLHETGEPVVVLDGRAELGPRALGNRSILAPATDPAMKDRLNDLKDRAPYRPVAPICLASEASQVFDPGNADRYMLFEHRLRPGWAQRVPAIMHLDGTARLQTIDPATANNAASRILREYWQLSGIPVLCNTSANLSGHGFFPDVASATKWGRTAYVWSAGMLYANDRSPIS